MYEEYLNSPRTPRRRAGDEHLLPAEAVRRAPARRLRARSASSPFPMQRAAALRGHPGDFLSSAARRLPSRPYPEAGAFFPGGPMQGGH
jgi:hypothetical protein